MTRAGSIRRHGNGPRRSDRAARARAARGQSVPWRQPRRGPPARVRRAGRRAGARRRRPHRRSRSDRCTRCTRTSCGPATRRSRSSTRSTASATARASPRGGSSAIQHGKAIFNLAASFQIVETGPEHSDPMPDVPDPESLPTFRERIEPHLDRLGPDLGAWLVRERPIDSRPVDDPPLARPDAARARAGRVDPDQRHAARRSAAAHVRRRVRVRPHAARHRDAAARDRRTAGGSGRSRASTMRCGSTVRSVPTSGCCTTRRARRPAARAGLAEGSIFRPDGMLAVTVIQEGLIRPIGQ